MLVQPTDILCKLQLMTKLSKKQRHQVKSRWYYIFWGAATVSVFAGQMYVGSGYRQMSRSFNRILDAVRFELMEPDHPSVLPYRSGKILEHGDDIIIWKEHQERLYHPTNPPKEIY